MKITYALLPVAILGCGQAAPQSESSHGLEAQQAQVQAGSAQAPSAAANGAPSLLAASPNAPFHCATDQLPRNNTLLAPTAIRKPDPKYRAPSGPPKPLDYTPAPRRAAAADPAADHAAGVEAAPGEDAAPEREAQ